MKKYELTNQIRVIRGKTLYRIRALRSFADVKEGDLGGFIEKEENLSHDGDCWVYDEACVEQDAHVSGNAVVCDYARVYEKARLSYDAKVFGRADISGTAHIWEDAEVFGRASVRGHAMVFGEAKVYGRAMIEAHAQVYDHAEVFDDARICDSARIYGNAVICGDAIIGGGAKIFGKAKVHGPAIVYDHAQVYAHAEVFDEARICGGAKIFGEAKVHDRAIVANHAHVDDNAEVTGDARVLDHAYITGSTRFCGYAQICGSVVVNEGETAITQNERENPMYKTTFTLCEKKSPDEDEFGEESFSFVLVKDTRDEAEDFETFRKQLWSALDTREIMNSGKYLLTIEVEKDGKYYDSDECVVDLRIVRYKRTCEYFDSITREYVSISSAVNRNQSHIKVVSK